MSMFHRTPIALAIALITVPALSQSATPFSPEEIKAAKQNPQMYSHDKPTLRVAAPERAASPAEIRSLGSPPAINLPASSPDNANPPLTLEEITNYGDRIWKIFLDNKPTNNLKSPPFATGLPKGLTDMTQMEGWQGPKVQHFKVFLKNPLGATIVDVDYMLSFWYGGSYQKKGKYITGVSIVQSRKGNVSWGQQLDMEASVPADSIVYLGKPSGAEGPVAAMKVVFKGTVSAPFDVTPVGATFVINGRGECKKLE